jgi:hypothetical protein
MYSKNTCLINVALLQKRIFCWKPNHTTDITPVKWTLLLAALRWVLKYEQRNTVQAKAMDINRLKPSGNFTYHQV